MLDVTMPGLDGIDVCRALRRTSVVPILFLQAVDRFRVSGMVVTCDGDGQATIGADALDAVLTSLLDNAATHAPGAAVRISVQAAAPWLQSTVANDGPGISAAYRADVFEPFFTTAPYRGGTGSACRSCEP
ncbi:MAG: hybrid sensor histidine kinase/response regulator [Janthinobacterium lividum]